MAMIFFQLRRPFVILINHALMDWTVQVTQAALLNTFVIAETGSKARIAKVLF